MSNTTLSLPLLSKSAEPNEAVMSAGSFHSADLIFVSHKLKELLLRACLEANCSMVFFFINLTRMQR